MDEFNISFGRDDTDEIREEEIDVRVISDAIFNSVSRSKTHSKNDLSRVDHLKSLTKRYIEKSVVFGEHQKSMLDLLAERKEEWWEKHLEKRQDELARLLYTYAVERSDRERKRREKAEQRRREIADVKITIPVSDEVRKVVERTKHYLETGRPESPFKENVIKPIGELSLRSRAEYAKATKQISAEWHERKVQTVWDALSWLVEVAQTKEKSSYKRLRAVVLRRAEAENNKAFVEMIKHLPQYSEICQILGRQTSRTVTKVTKDRRTPHNEKNFQKVLGHLSDEYRAVISVLRLTGARSAEASSIRLDRYGNSIRVSIESVKTGSRQKKNVPDVRSWDISIHTAEGRILDHIQKEFGSTPCAGKSADSIRAAWRRARTHEGLNNDSRWDLHSLRHAFAHSEKKRLYSSMESLHGKNWREKLYGKNWKHSQEYLEMAYSDLAQKLGHTSLEMVKIYG